MFSRDTKFKDIFAHPKLKTIKKFIVDPPMEGPINTNATEEELCDITIEEYARSVSPAWNPDSMAEGLSYIDELIQRNKLKEISVYDKEELMKDPSKKATGLLLFQVEEKGPFALICAGGAYCGVASIVEAFPVAKRLNELGINAFVFRYRAGVYGAVRKSNEDLIKALKVILENRKELNVTDEYIAFGFSAGGHLLTELGTSNHGYRINGIPKPAMLGLGYPAVSLDWMPDDSHLLYMMSDEGNVQKLREEFSPMNYINNEFPKCFIWQTVDDELVNYEKNGLELYKRLKEKNIPCKLKEVKHGYHGLGLGIGSEAEGWLEEAIAYWKE